MGIRGSPQNAFAYLGQIRVFFKEFGAKRVISV